MNSPLMTTLLISGIGITLLFLALGLFYGLLSLLMRLAEGRHSGGEGAVPDEPEPVGDEAMLQAAAIAVALARAQAEQTAGPLAPAGMAPLSSPAIASAWWTLHHQRQLSPSSTSAWRRE